MKTFAVTCYIRAENESDLFERIEDSEQTINEVIDGWNPKSIRIVKDD